MINLAFVTASVSRDAGGIYDALRFLALTLNEKPEISTQVVGLKDNHTARDLSGWGELLIHAPEVNGPSSFGFSSQYMSVLQNINPDIVHTHGLWMYPSMASKRWAHKTDRPYIISPHGMLDPWAVRNSYWKKRFSGLLYEDPHLRGAACLHALCESEAKSMREYGLKNPICIIPNGVYSPKQILKDSPPWRKNIPDNAKILLFLGRLHPKKGLLNLLEGWAKAHQNPQSDDWHLVIAGWGQDEFIKSLEEMIAGLNIQKSVHLVGAMFDELKNASYQCADAFILPSFSEGLPMTILEAWSHSLPVLITPECNLGEGFSANAAIHITSDSSGISKGLVELFVMTTNELLVMGVQGQKLVDNNFNWVTIANHMLEVYLWVLQMGEKPDCVSND